MREVVCVVVLALLLTGSARIFTSDWAKLEHEIYLKLHDAMYRAANGNVSQ
jgi:hypothetical protein